MVSTLSVLLGTRAAELGTVLPQMFAPLAAVSFLLFTLLYTPCVAAVATIRRELRSTPATVGVVFLQCLIAWLVAFLVYQIGGLLL